MGKSTNLSKWIFVKSPMKWASGGGVSVCRERANVVDFDFATSCHFMPLQVAYATSSGVCHFEWRVPLRVACATSSGVLTV